MGLCKCPKKSVTNQFCFEHHVNVCEHCMVTNHSKCVVQSYLLWLQDSDYDPNCQLCKTELIDGECVRLICYHVFHWECLNKYASEMPPHTAPAGYTCPICNVGIFPASNMVSPVAETLRNTLLGVNWARCGLAFPLVDENHSARRPLASNGESPPKDLKTEPQITELKSKSNSQYSIHSNHTKSENARGSRPEPYGASYTSGNFAAPRKVYDTTEHSQIRPVIDHDEKKYQRRSALEWLGRWFQSKTLLGGTRRRDPNILYKRWVVIGMLVILTLCTITIWFLRMGRASADSDPMLDPHLNPNIRVHDKVDGVLPDSPNGMQKESLNLDNGMKHIVPR